MTYEAHNALIVDGRDKSGVLRLIAGVIVVAIVTCGWAIAVLFAVYFAAGSEAGPQWLERLLYAQSPTSTLLLLTTIWGVGFGAMAAVRLLHTRNIASLFGPPRALWRGFLIAVVVCWVIFAISFIIPTEQTPIPNTGFSLWLNFLPISLFVIFAQTGAEEILFRGYLQQQLAARFQSRVIWLVLPSLLFGVLHFDPNLDTGPMLLVLAATTIFGLCAADLTALTGSIGAAWGFHFANNVMAILIVSLDDRLSGMSLYVLPLGAEESSILIPLLLLDILITLLVWFAIRTTLRRFDQ